MTATAGAPREAHDVWSLHVARYASIAFAVLASVWMPEPPPGLPAAIGWTSVVLLLDLALHGPRRGRSVPAVAALQAGAATAAFLAAPGLPTAVVAAVVVAGIAAVLPPRWRSAIAIGVAGLTSVAAARAVGVDFALATVAGYGLALWVGATAAGRARDAAAFAAAVAALESAQERLTALADAGREHAVDHERQRIASDVHDTLGHALMAMLVQVQVARRVLATDPDDADRRLGAVEADARATLARVRATLRRTLDDGVHVGLATGVEHLVRDFERASGTGVELALLPDAADLNDLDHRAADALVRTVREALTNAVRHGKAARVRVELEAVGPRVHLRIEDDGVGTDDPRPGMGLAAMVARIQAVGGSIRFDSRAGHGFRVEVAVRRR